MESLLDLLFPRQCLACKKSGRYMCSQCLALVPKSGLFFAYKNKYLKGGIALWKYQGIVRKAIMALKYKFAHQISRELGNFASGELQKRNFFNTKNLVMTCIPLHAKRARWRGFNQAELLGKYISTNLNWPFEPELLIRTKHTKQQVGLAKSERIRNIRGIFAVNNVAADKIKGKIVIVFDDVWTTGATITEAAKVLKKSGAREVWALTLAR